MNKLSYILLFIFPMCYGQGIVYEGDGGLTDAHVQYMIDSTNRHDTLIVGGLKIDPDGLILSGSSTVWDDLRVPATQTRLGANNLPAYDYTHMALDFVSDADTNEITYFNVQTPHTWNDSSYLRCHFHWEQTAANDSFVFHLAYRVFPIGGVQGTWKYISLTNATELTYTSGTIHNIAEFQPILLNGGVSSFIDLKLYRFGTYGITHVYVKGFDIHYEIEKLGTDNEY